MPREPAADDLTGREVAGYVVLRRLGAGGMAEVYLAEQRSLRRQVALKVLEASLAQDSAYVARFQHEARAAASLIHANIVQIYEVGHAGGVHFIAQEYVPGKNLGELLKREASLAPELVIDVLRQVAGALAKAAELGIVHRDIKPENILLSQSGEVKVADFGLARYETADAQALTQAGVTMGTPLYMSPEQIEGRNVDGRSDIYSLGVTAYHLLAGAPPHVGETALAIAVQHLNSPPRPLQTIRGDIPGGLVRIVHRMMAKRPADRYSSAGELLSELRSLAAGELFEESGPSGVGDAGVGARSKATAELGELMRQATRLEAPPWLRGRTAALVAAAAVGGLVLGALTRPRPLLADREPTGKVDKLDSAWTQLAHANLAPSEAAWRAVEEYFPDAEPFVKDLSAEGLIRYYLFVSKDFAAALAALDKWPEPSGNDQSQLPLRAFRYASLAIVNQQLGLAPEARLARSQLTAEMSDYLRRNDSRLFELLQRASESLGQ